MPLRLNLNEFERKIWTNNLNFELIIYHLSDQANCCVQNKRKSADVFLFFFKFLHLIAQI